MIKDEENMNERRKELETEIASLREQIALKNASISVTQAAINARQEDITIARQQIEAQAVIRANAVN